MNKYTFTHNGRTFERITTVSIQKLANTPRFISRFVPWTGSQGTRPRFTLWERVKSMIIVL